MTALTAKALAEKLMSWKLPQDFSPDCYIRFDREAAAAGSWPVGTNLLTVAQAEQMFAYVLNAELESLRGSQQAERAVPAGWPTDAMIEAGRKAAQSHGPLLGNGQSLWHVFRDMLAAAPVQQAAPAGEAERKLFEAWMKSEDQADPEPERTYELDEAGMNQLSEDIMWVAWQARAAIASQQP